MSLTIGDLQILYHMAAEESKKNEGNPKGDPKTAEVLEDALRGEI